MLRYLGMGRRPFGLQPMYVHRRANWEFFAVLQGRCGVVIPGQSRPTLHTRRLWVFPPETAHGWRGEGIQPCRVAVFHFGRVPDLLEKAARDGKYLDCPLTAAQARWIAGLARELAPHYMRTTQKSLLVFERAMLELSLLALGPAPSERTEDKNDFALRKVEAGLTWYSEHMSDQPKIEHVAQAINVSARHLRRLFQEARRESPQAGFTKLRIHRAMELLSQSGVKLDEIAAKCGFSSDSDFCRVFKARQKISPDAWRKRKLRAYKMPDRG
jgi:AraC family transcriptional regulator